MCFQLLWIRKLKCHLPSDRLLFQKRRLDCAKRLYSFVGKGTSVHREPDKCGELDYRKQAELISNWTFKTKHPPFQSLLVGVIG